MRLLILFLILAAALNGAVAFVQSASASAGYLGNTTTRNASFSVSLTAGSCVVGAAWWNVNTVTLTSVTDNKSGGSNTYTQIDSLAGSGYAGASFYAKNVGAATTLTVTVSGTVQRIGVVAHEVSGCDTTSPLDGNNKSYQSPSTSTDAVTSGTFTPTVNGAYVFGATLDQQLTSNTVAAGTNFTSRAGFTDPFLLSENLIQSTAGSIAATFTQSGAGYPYTLTFGVALKPAATAAPPRRRIIVIQ